MQENLALPVRRLRQWSVDTPDAPALHERGPAGWEPISWADYHERACRVGEALLALGLEAGECVVILSGNRAEWLYAQYGITMAGGVVAPCYQTNASEMVAYLVDHCGARTVLVENAAQLAKLDQVRDRLPGLRQVVVFDAEEVGDREDVLAFDAFLELGGPPWRAVLEERLEELQPDDDCFVIYTSGTTGRPKAVALSHANLAASGRAVIERFPIDRTRMISYLPLCHIAEQSATNLTQLETGGEIFLCRDVAKMPAYLPEVRPNSLFGVPRIWEKVEAALQGRFDQARGMKRWLLGWARGVETRAFEHKARHGSYPRSVSRWLAHKLVLSGIRSKLGMDQVVHTLSGAAPISVGTLRFFASLGFHLHEVYGLSETCGLLTATCPQEVATGTVGKPVRGVEIRIAADGEILCRGPALSRGYLHDPEASRVLWQDDWMATGDIGRFDEAGNLRITDRKKDLIITAQAKNVAPQPIEAGLKRIPGVSQAVVIGDRRKYLVALLTLEEGEAEQRARALGLEVDDPDELPRHAAFEAWVGEQVKALNAKLARYETIRRFAILPRDFSIEGGELTPTMKVKRRVVERKYQAEIEAIYAGTSPT